MSHLTDTESKIPRATTSASSLNTSASAIGRRHPTERLVVLTGSAHPPSPGRLHGSRGTGQQRRGVDRRGRGQRHAGVVRLGVREKLCQTTGHLEPHPLAERRYSEDLAEIAHKLIPGFRLLVSRIRNGRRIVTLAHQIPPKLLQYETA
jgi:hypothetical protein